MRHHRAVGAAALGAAGAYLAVITALDVLWWVRDAAWAEAALTVLTFPSHVLVTVLLLLLAALTGWEETAPGEGYAPSVYAVAGLVQAVLALGVLWLARRRPPGLH
ncbi:hypothetical protein [Streptomyces sp. cmx-4-9]|uniref:hypothetical protein n=1 Tax=Streptomyces sp. cmx-4-9 TaxID=2790941 RepID=UPI00397EE87A